MFLKVSREGYVDRGHPACCVASLYAHRTSVSVRWRTVLIQIFPEVKPNCSKRFIRVQVALRLCCTDPNKERRIIEPHSQASPVSFIIRVLWCGWELQDGY